MGRFTNAKMGFSILINLSLKRRFLMNKIFHKLVLIFVFFLCQMTCLICFHGGGVVPYCKHKGEIFFLFGQDSLSKNKVWGDFGGSFDSARENIEPFPELSRGFYKILDQVYSDEKNRIKFLIAKFAHEGTIGVFAKLQPSLFEFYRGKWKIRRELLWEGLDFWVDKFDDMFVICTEEGDIRYSLYFVEIDFFELFPFDSYKGEVKKIQVFDSENKTKYDAYLRRSEYVWIYLDKLLAAIYKCRNEKNINISFKYGIRFKDGPRRSIILNQYLSRELLSKRGAEILELLRRKQGVLNK